MLMRIQSFAMQLRVASGRVLQTTPPSRILRDGSSIAPPSRGNAAGADDPVRSVDRRDDARHTEHPGRAEHAGRRDDVRDTEHTGHAEKAGRAHHSRKSRHHDGAREIHEHHDHGGERRMSIDDMVSRLLGPDVRPADNSGRDLYQTAYTQARRAFIGRIAGDGAGEIVSSLKAAIADQVDGALSPGKADAVDSLLDDFSGNVAAALDRFETGDQSLKRAAKSLERGIRQAYEGLRDGIERVLTETDAPVVPDVPVGGGTGRGRDVTVISATAIYRSVTVELPTDGGRGTGGTTGTDTGTGGTGPVVDNGGGTDAPTRRVDVDAVLRGIDGAFKKAHKALKHDLKDVRKVFHGLEEKGRIDVKHEHEHGHDGDHGHSGRVDVARAFVSVLRETFLSLYQPEADGPGADGDGGTPTRDRPSIDIMV